MTAIEELPARERAEVEQNLFPQALEWVRRQQAFPWHRYRDRVTTGWPNSSQALALDVFATLRMLQRPDRIVGTWTEALGLPPVVGAGAEDIDVIPEAMVEKRLLGEPQSTQVDALFRGSRGRLLVEAKFTEEDGGGCSQPEPLQEGANKGKRQCNGSYELQVNPVKGTKARCALTAKGIRYWELIPEVLAIDPGEDHRPCPFKGGWYQWMRNLVACRALAEADGLNSAVLIVYAEGPFPMAKKIRSKKWTAFVGLTEGRGVPLITASYQHLLQLAIGAATPGDIEVLRRLNEWVEDKIERVAQARS